MVSVRRHVAKGLAVCLRETHFAVPTSIEAHCVDAVVEKALSPCDRLKLVNGRHLISLFHLHRWQQSQCVQLCGGVRVLWHQRAAQWLSDGICPINHQHMGAGFE